MWRQVSIEGRKRLSGYVLPFVMQASWRCVQHIFLHAGVIKNGPKDTFCLLHHLFFWHVCSTTCDGKPPPKTGDFVATVGRSNFRSLGLSNTVMCGIYMELLLPGVIKLPILRESNNTNFYGNFLRNFLLQQGIVWVDNIMTPDCNSVN